jgi:hypothetical protein
MIKRIAPFLALPVVLACAGPAAAALSLQALFAGGSLTVENALFDNWTLNSLTVTDPGQTVDLNQIIVSEVFGDPLRPGLGFDGGGQLRVSNAGFQFLDLDFSFTVEAINGADPFVYNGLSIDGYELVSGDGGVQLEETVRTSAGGTELAFKETYVDTFLGDDPARHQRHVRAADGAAHHQRRLRLQRPLHRWRIRARRVRAGVLIRARPGNAADDLRRPRCPRRGAPDTRAWTVSDAPVTLAQPNCRLGSEVSHPMKSPIVILFAGAAVALLLTGCTETTGDTRAASASPEASSRMPTQAEQGCLRDVTGTTNNPDVVMLSSSYSEAGTEVIVGVGPQRARWRCIGYKDGTTAGIMSLTDEGAL